MAEKKKYNSILISGRKDQTLTYSKYVKDEESGESVKESLDKKVNVTDELTTQQIKDGAITNEKMAADSVGNTNLQDGSVSNEKLEDGSITNEKLAENSITKDKLQDKTIGVEKLDNELRQAIAAATGLPENLVETIQNVDDTLKNHQRQLDDKQSQIDDKQQQITANDEDISLLQTRSTQIEETIKSIAATGGASQATAVTYNNEKSGLTAVNAQAAIDEVDSKLSDLSKKAATKFYFSLNTTGECSAKFDDENGVVVFSPFVTMRRFNGEKDTDVDIHEKLVAAGCTYDEKTGLCTLTFGKNANNNNITIYYLNGTYGVTRISVYEVPKGAEVVLHIAKNPDTFYFYGGAAAIWTECYNNSKINKVVTNAATKFYVANKGGKSTVDFDYANKRVTFYPFVTMRRFNGEKDTDVDIHEKLVAAGCTYDEKTGLCTITFADYNNSNLTIYRLNDAYGVSEANFYSVPNGAELVLSIAINDVGFYFYGGAATIWTECYNNSKINKVATNAAKNVGNQVITQFSHQYQRDWALGQKKITLLHFSDIHGDEKNFKRIVQYVEENKSMLTDVICTGDIVNYQFSDGIDWWKNNIGDNKILMAIGNHDPLVTQGTWDWFGKNAAECYDRYFSPFIAKWGVNYTQDLCYYCKDYSDVSIRLIVLDGMRWNNIKEDTVQEEWFKQQLNDAKEKNLHVVVASHFPPDTSVGNKNNNINFDCWYSTQQWEKESYGLLSPKVADAINDFQTSGGKFICYIGGHTHGDLFRPLKRYPNQLMVIVANASCYEHVNNAGCWYSRHESDNSQELFNLLNIDTENKILSIVRVGCCFDRYARHIGTISFDYENHKVLSQY